jgi:hypothetical protein
MMTHHSKWNIAACCTLVLALIIACVCDDKDANPQYPILEQHSFHAPFLMTYGAGSIPHWEYGGSALVTENYIRLTPAIQSKTGYIYNTEPVHVRNWRVDLRFEIHNTHALGADGLAFWYVKQPEKTSGPLFGQKEYFKGLGIIFDTYDNNGNGDGPSIIAISGNGDPNAKWDIDHDLLANQLERCKADFRNAIGGVVTSRITYENHVLTVDVDTMGSGKFVRCFTIRDLKLPTGYYFQLTAVTGGLADYHDVHSFITYDLSPKSKRHERDELNDDRNLHRRERQHRHGWYDPYAHPTHQHDQQQQHQQPPQQQQQELPYQQQNSKPSSNPITRDFSDSSEHEFFEGLREKMKHFHEDESNKQQKKADPSKSTSTNSLNEELSINTQTNLLILEALEEVARTVKRSSTKDDINNIIAQVTAIISKQQSVQTELLELKDNIKREFSSMMNEFSKGAQSLRNDINKLEKYINSLNTQMGDLSTKQGQFHHGLEQHRTQLQETIKSSTSYGFWLFFILFQTAFVVGFIYYKKYAEIKSTKLY